MRCLLGILLAWSCAVGASDDVAKSYGASFTRGFVETDEGRVSYLQRKGEGMPLFLIPGSYNDAGQWKWVVRGLPESMPLVLVELRGHGESWPPPANGSIEQFAGDVLAIADAAGVGPFVAGGHSIGGMVALELGRRAPERVRGVISIEGWTHHTAQQLAFGTGKDPEVSEKLAQERARLRARVNETWTEAQRKAFGQIWRTWDGREFLMTTELPILEIYGDRGRPHPGREALLIPERINVELVWITGATHTVPLEAPEEVARLITGYMAWRK